MFSLGESVIPLLLLFTLRQRNILDLAVSLKNKIKITKFE